MHFIIAIICSILAGIFLVIRLRKGKKETSLVYVPDRLEFRNLLNGKANFRKTMQNWKHVYQSYMSKRSTNSVTILLLGISGAGKSSTINSLFGTNICEVDENKSCTKGLIEISAKFPSKFLGMSNSQIHVIDTPGFYDTTRGINFDGRVIANISDFFKSKDYFPNIVLLVLNINDNRIDGEFSPFVRTLKIIQLQLVKTVIDKEHPNLVIVLTHLCQANDRRNPSKKIKLVKRLIAEHLGVTNCPVVVAENRPDDNNLTRKGPDYYQLPNGDLFPKNIFEAMIELTKNVDGVGYYLIQDAYRNLPKLKTEFEKTSHQIVRKPAENIIIEELIDMNGEARNELHEQINAAWRRLPDEERINLLPSQISRTLKNLGYESSKHLPKTQKELITFFRNFSYDDDIRLFLQNTFALSPPRLGIDFKVGNGYDITMDALLSSSEILSIGQDVYHKLGCFLGERIELHNNPEIHFYCEIFQSSEECLIGRLKQLGIDISKPEVAKLAYQYRNGYNIYQGNSTQNLTAVYERRLMKLSLKNVLASDEIKRSLNELPTWFDKDDSTNVNKWTNFFRNYGTHYVSSAYIGGSVSFTVRGVMSTQMNQLLSCHQGDITGFVKLFMSSSNCQQNNFESNISGQQNCEITMTVSGGKQAEGMYLAQSKNHEEFESRLKLWEETILDNPMVSDLSITLGDIADVVHNVRPDLFNAMKQAVADLYGVKMSLEIQPAKNENPSRENDTAPPSNGSGCLTPDTLISTFSGSVPISQLKAGDFVLDGTGEAVKVLAVVRVYSEGVTKLFGFEGSQLGHKPFFTEEHPFASSDGNILTVNKCQLHRLHPQLKWNSNIVQMPETNIELISFEESHFQTTIVPKLTSTFTKNEPTELFFLIVEGCGSYIANGFVTFVQAPNFQAWPKTFMVIYATVLPLKYISLDNKISTNKLRLMRNFVNLIQLRWQSVANEICPSTSDVLNYNLAIGIEFNSFGDKQLNDLFTNDSTINFALMLYSTCGELLYKNVDQSGMDPMNFINSARPFVDELLLVYI